MTATTVLLRSLVRICDAEAALIVIDGSPRDVRAHGLDADDAARTLAAFERGAALPNGLNAAWIVPVPCTGAGRSAQLYIFDTGAGIAPPLGPAVTALAAELGRELEAEQWPHADSESPAAGLIEQIARGLDSLNDAAAILEWPASDAAGQRIRYVNRAFEGLLGFAAGDIAGVTTDLLWGPLTAPERTAFMNDRVRQMLQARIPIVYYRRDGTPLWVEVSVRGVAATATSDACVVATLRDVSDRKEFEFALAKEKRKLQVTLAAIGDGVITTVADGRIDYVNLAARTMLGTEAAEAYGKPINDVLCLRDPAGIRVDVLLDARAPDTALRGEAQFESSTARKDIAYVTSPIGDEGFVVVLRDVTAQRRLSTQLSYEASHDMLTRISNRRKFEQVLEAAIASAGAGGGPHALALLDLDRFKIINDTCGHGVGDRVLTDIARLLQAQLRERDLVARIGGDEFAVLLHECTLDNARHVFESLRGVVDAYKLQVGNRVFAVGVSIGVTAVDGAETDAGRIVARADAACYAAKSAGRNAIAG